MESIKPNWSGEARLPHTIRLPIQIANALHGIGSGRREIVIRRQDENVPALIIEWMQGDPHYRTWFLAGQEPKTLPAEQPEEVVTPPVEAEPDTVEIAPFVEPDDLDKPIKRGRRKKAADDGE